MEKYTTSLQLGFGILSFAFLAVAVRKVNDSQLTTACLHLGVSLCLLSMVGRPEILFRPIRRGSILADIMQPTVVPIWVWVVETTGLLLMLAWAIIRLGGLLLG